MTSIDRIRARVRAAKFTFEERARCEEMEEFAVEDATAAADYIVLLEGMLDEAGCGCCSGADWPEAKDAARAWLSKVEEAT